MKQQVKYQVVNVPGKLRFEVKILVDDSKDRGEYVASVNGDKFTSLTIYPILTLSIIRTGELDENGHKTKAPYNPNDILSMGRYNYPIFINELEAVRKGFNTPELYSYVDKRLEMDEELASKVRRVFMITNTVIEMAPVVIVQPDESKIEGLKIKFNNEQSSVLLTLNDVESLIFTMKNIDIDFISMTLYNQYIKTGVKNYSSESTPNNNFSKPSVDIIPKDNTAF
jgi:hypothetical protein